MADGELYVLKGCGGHARSIADAILSDRPDAAVLFVDSNAGEGERIMGFDVVAERSTSNDVEVFVFNLCADNANRVVGCWTSIYRAGLREVLQQLVVGAGSAGG